MGERDPGGDALARFRGYLKLLVEGEFQGPLRRRLDPSDVVQEALVRAHRGWSGFRGKNDAELAAWLRQIVARTLASSLRDQCAARRDVRRERSLEESMERATDRLASLPLAGRERDRPSAWVEREERAVRLARALEELPAAQREALMERHWRGRSLAEIAEVMDRTPASVAGLLRRGLARLRAQLDDLRDGIG